MSGEQTQKEVITKETVVTRAESCEKCQFELDWADCWNCGGEGFSYHDCGEDCCCCLNPEDNVECDICQGEGGYWACPMCQPGAFE